jgi:hypothetical protein
VQTLLMCNKQMATAITCMLLTSLSCNQEAINDLAMAAAAAAVHLLGLLCQLLCALILCTDATDCGGHALHIPAAQFRPWCRKTYISYVSMQHVHAALQLHQCTCTGQLQRQHLTEQ